ncbi:MAG TPA: helix-turn-helix transcriptional regulator [Streptosporangiaceae bacterium]|nr:helix-turn-helix transcriptional regulator [Streptosporangiaceae bacterium]
MKLSPSEQAVAARLRELRLAAGLSQSGLAERMAGLGWPWHQQTVNQAENRKRKLRLGELVDLAAIYGIPPARLLADERDWTPGDERREMERAIREQIAAEIGGRPEAAALCPPPRRPSARRFTASAASWTCSCT